MESFVDPLAALTAAQVALLLVAVQYAVLAPAWVVAAMTLPGERRPALWCAVYALASSLGLALIVAGMARHDEVLRAAGNVLAIVGMLALQRGIWAFSGLRARPLLQLTVLALATTFAGLAMVSPAQWGPVRIAIVSALWGGIYAWAAADVIRGLHTEPAPRLRLVCALPLLAGAVLLGVRAVRATVAPESVMAEASQDSWLSVGSAVAGLVAALVLQLSLVGLLVARMVGRMDRLSRHDPLTGLMNRRAIDQLLQQEEHRVRRLAGGDAGHFAVLMLDIDHFKRINDERGHGAGDLALQHVARLMAGNLRQMDQVARWGGEEFLAMLPATSGEEAEGLAERVRERIASAVLLIEGEQLVLSASIGVSSWLGDGDTREALVARADEALYSAKRDGRNRVRRHAGPVMAAGGRLPHAA